MKISFDYDMTLSEPYVQTLASLLVKAGADVWVVTARHDDKVMSVGKVIGHQGHNMDLRRVIEKVGIPHEKVIYTNGDWKYKVYFDRQFELHFDDMFNEVENINRRGGKAVLVDYSMHDQAYELFSVDNLNELIE